jgi:hypothetical protein
MTPFDWKFPYHSQRMPVLARNVVATSQPLAAQAGLSMLMKGGNAVDAALNAKIFRMRTSCESLSQLPRATASSSPPAADRRSQADL